MSGNPAAGLYVAIIFCLAFLYGFTVINIVIGLLMGFFCLARHCCLTEDDLKEKNLRLCAAWFISMIPIIGPLLAVNHLTG